MDNSQYTVMVAEDDKFLIKVYQVKLAKEGFQVIIANDGEEAIEKLSAGAKPDIVLLDLIMPKKTGLEVLAYIKSVPELSTIPVIILSNLGQAEDMRKGMEAGANDYIIKADVHINDVVTKIVNLLSSSAI